MTDLEALYAGIIENPADLDRRLFYADALEEDGKQAHAEFIRGSIKHGWEIQMTKDRAAIIDVSDVENTWPASLIRLADGIPGVQWTVRNGFPEGVTLTAEKWLKHGDELVCRFPIQAVSFTTFIEGAWMECNKPQGGVCFGFICSFPARCVPYKEIGARRIREIAEVHRRTTNPDMVDVLRGFWPTIPRHGWKFGTGDLSFNWRIADHTIGHRMS